MALGLTQPLTEMCTRHISWWSKGSQCIRLTKLPPSCANFLEIFETQHHGTLKPCPGIGFNVLILTINLTIYCTILTIHYMLLIFLKMEII
jgi:hypothetical protein